MERYYFTFCVGLDKPHRNCYHVIEAEDAESARDKMFETFGQDWAFQYTEQQWRISKEDYDRMKNWRTVGEWHEGYTQAELFSLKEIRFMTQEDKQLLLVDLCGRLPYNVKCQFEDNIRLTDGESSPFYDDILSAHHLELFMRHSNFYIKPYLRPLSLMTEEEKNEYLNTFKKSIIGTDEEDGSVWTVDSIDWLNKKMFDYRGLVPKDLAISTEVFNPYKIKKL